MEPVTLSVNLILVLFVMFCHWFSDFVCQTDYQATNKSTKITALLEHGACYGLLLFGSLGVLMCIPFLPFTTVVPTIGALVKFSLINMVLHTMIDFFTSKVSSMYYKQQRFHEFFVTVGFDQFLHTVCLLSTMYLYF